MRKDKSFLEGKLNEKDFEKKYWLDGDAPYQYHTMEIADGRDEREQLIINNIRALDKNKKFYYELLKDRFGGMMEADRKTIKKITILGVTSMVISVSALIFTIINKLVS